MNPNDLILMEVKGFCMWPFLNDGQKILVRKTDGADLHPGDLLLYRGGSGLLCHRLARKEKKDNAWILYCKPDTSLSAGEPVKEDTLEGKVVAVVSHHKVISLETTWARWQAVMILGVLSPALALILSWYKKIRKL
jgi:hypothetical protein